MGYWERVSQRLSVPGLIVLAVGILLITQAAKLCRLALKEKGEKVILPLKIFGLVLVVLAALILLDFIPGL